MFEKVALLSAAIFQIVELAKLAYDSKVHKINKDLIVALALGLLIAFGLPLDAFAAAGIVFTKLLWVGKLLTGLLLGGVGAGVIHWIFKKAQ